MDPLLLVVFEYFVGDVVGLLRELVVLEVLHEVFGFGDVLLDVAFERVGRFFEFLLQHFQVETDFLLDDFVGFTHVEVEDAVPPALQVFERGVVLVQLALLLVDLLNMYQNGVDAVFVLNVVELGVSETQLVLLVVELVAVDHNILHLVEVRGVEQHDLVPVLADDVDHGGVVVVVLGVCVEDHGHRLEGVHVVLGQVDVGREVGGVGVLEQPFEVVEFVDGVPEEQLDGLLELVPLGLERDAVGHAEADGDLEVLDVAARVGFLHGLFAVLALVAVDQRKELVVDAAAHHVLDQFQEVEQHFVVFHCEFSFDLLQRLFLRLLDQRFVFVLLENVVVSHSLLFDIFAQLSESSFDTRHQFFLKVFQRQL